MQSAENPGKHQRSMLNDGRMITLAFLHIHKPNISDFQTHTKKSTACKYQVKEYF